MTLWRVHNLTMKRARGDYQTIAVNLDARQVHQLRNLSALTGASISLHARAAIAAYLAAQAAAGYSAPQIHSVTMNSAQEN